MLAESKNIQKKRKARRERAQIITEEHIKGLRGAEWVNENTARGAFIYFCLINSGAVY